MAYTYMIGWSHLGKYYYGMRAAHKVAPKDDIWKIYKTSSRYVHEFEALNGPPDTIHVDKEFETKEEAYIYETEFLRKVDAIHSDMWLNQNIMGKPQGGTPAQLAAVSKPQSEEHKLKRGIYKPKSAETRAKMSDAHKGENNSMYGITGEEHPQFGRKRTPEQVERIRQGQIASVAKRRASGDNFSKPPRSEEHRQRLSDAAKKRWADRKARGLGRFNEQ